MFFLYVKEREKEYWIKKMGLILTLIIICIDGSHIEIMENTFIFCHQNYLPFFLVFFFLFYHTCEPSGGSIFLPLLRVPSSLPSTFKIFRLWKKSSTIKSWPTFCVQYFWKFPIWNSRADEKRREMRMVKVNVIFNDIRLLICLTPLQVKWVMVIN